MVYHRSGDCRDRTQSRFVATLLAGSAMAFAATPAMAQDSDTSEAAEEDGGTIVVTGIRSSLRDALNEKRNADSLVEVIQAEDIGKLPDQNLAEVLENITGIQITRTAGVGTGVQIRGTNDNRTEINGVGTVSSGSGRGGINFEDVNAAIISSVEVTKAPTAKTVEGSVGGTINLRTIRPLDIGERILTVRAQGEYSELSESVTPRLSASYGSNWAAGEGEMGIVLAGSWTRQEATSFRPRVDRDTLIVEGSSVTSTGGAGPDFDYLGIQFLNQELENFEFETYNIAGTFEWAPGPDLKFFVDGFYNNQERRQDSSRVQASGVSSLRFVNVPGTFETVNFGSLGGVDLGSIQAAQSGVIAINLAADDDDPNLRFSSDTGARVTENYLFRGGLEFQTGRLSASAEISQTGSDTTNPNLSTTLNFINPNVPLDGSSNDNSTPFEYDLSGGSLTFGVAFDSPFAPTIDQLLDPNNTVLDAITASRNETNNSETAARFDLSLDLEDLTGFITSFDVGYRYNDASTEFTQIRSSFGTGSIANSPSGSLFADLIVPGPDNFGDFDGRELAFRNFLLIDPNRAFNDPDGTLDILQAALDTTNGSISDPDPNTDSNRRASYRVEETTHSVYGQLNFDFGRVRGNAGLRWIGSNSLSLGNPLVLEASQDVKNSYDQWLPRVNVTADITDDLVLRASWTEDINRPDFQFLSQGLSFPSGPNDAVLIGNPNLAPETVTSFDASLSWYFAPAAVISIGAFHKSRTNLFVQQEEAAELDENGFRDITEPCEGGGIFNPVPDRNVLSDTIGNGLCVPIRFSVNDPGTTKQKGIEVAFQYDLSAFEDTLGFASGFGVIANYTYQEFSGGEALDTSDADSRGTAILESSSGQTGPFTAPRGLLDFSKNAYNITLFYEKYGLSARARYTWRDAFRTLDTAGGASLGSTVGFPVVTAARGQLNGSVVYEVSDNLSFGVEGVNLTKSKIEQFCVNDSALLCFQGLPDRRITFGATLKL
ncbi:MAG: TonB-dependent receptor [Pseudomonadota bacterium]